MLACDISGGAPDVARRALLDQRLVINATGPGTLRLLPPLTIDRTDVQSALERLSGALA